MNDPFKARQAIYDKVSAAKNAGLEYIEPVPNFYGVEAQEALREAVKSKKLLSPKELQEIVAALNIWARDYMQEREIKVELDVPLPHERIKFLRKLGNAVRKRNINAVIATLEGNSRWGSTIDLLGEEDEIIKRLNDLLSASPGALEWLKARIISAQALLTDRAQKQHLSLAVRGVGRHNEGGNHPYNDWLKGVLTTYARHIGKPGISRFKYVGKDESGRERVYGPTLRFICAAAMPVLSASDLQRLKNSFTVAARVKNIMK